MLITGCTQEQSELGNTAEPFLGHDIPSDGSQNTVAPDLAVEGWTQLIMFANSAKTTIDTMAHFNTNRNACGKDAYGVIRPSDLWNKLIKYTNLAIKNPPRTEEYCTSTHQELDSNGYYKKYMDGSVQAVVDGGTKRTLFEQKGSDICTTIDDPLVSNTLFTILNQIVLIADKEDCPNGWGSALESGS